MTRHRARGALVALAAAGLATAACAGSQTIDESAAADEPVRAESKSGLRQARAPEVDEGPRDGMEVEGLRGHLTAFQIQTGVRSHERALTRCYAHNAEHEYIGGRIVFGFDVDRDGTVIEPTITSSALGAWPVEACLLDVVTRMTFAPPDGGVATVTLPLDFDGRGAVATWHEEVALRELKAPPGEPPPAQDAEPRVRQVAQRGQNGAREADEPATKREDLEGCREQTGAAPPAGGRATVYIARDGRVTSIGFSASAHIDPDWASCAIARMQAWRMTAPKTPGVAVVKLSFPLPQSL